MKTEKYKRTEWGLITLAVLMPIIMLLGATFITGHGFGITRFIPTLSDEVVWYSQISTMVEKGKILGYYGYNGSVAQVGGYGPWGFFTLLPYVLVGKLFGSHFYMMVLANILFLTIAVAVFLLLTKPNRRQLIMIILLQPSVYYILLYSSLSMAEGLRFSFSIILAGIMAHLLNKRGGKILLYVIAPITLLFCCLCYMVNIIWIPVYLYTNQLSNDRIASNTRIESFESKKRFLEEKMQVDLEGNRRENIIACYTYSYNTMLELPSGLALKLMSYYRKTCKAKCIMRTDVGRSRMNIILDTLSTAGYREYCTTDDYIIYGR